MNALIGVSSSKNIGINSRKRVKTEVCQHTYSNSFIAAGILQKSCQKKLIPEVCFSLN